MACTANTSEAEIQKNAFSNDVSQTQIYFPPKFWCRPA